MATPRHLPYAYDPDVEVREPEVAVLRSIDGVELDRQAITAALAGVQSTVVSQLSTFPGARAALIAALGEDGFCRLSRDIAANVIQSLL